MKLRSLLYVVCLGFLTTVFADNRHGYPNTDTNTATKKTMLPGYCEIEIINNSYSDVTIYGTFDDGAPLSPFNVYRLGIPQYIDLFYYDPMKDKYRCHDDMYLDIVTYNGYHIYSGYTRTGTTVELVPYLTKQIKANLHTK
jgi:hypothetical protein